MFRGRVYTLSLMGSTKTPLRCYASPSRLKSRRASGEDDFSVASTLAVLESSLLSRLRGLQHISFTDTLLVFVQLDNRCSFVKRPLLILHSTMHRPSNRDSIFFTSLDECFVVIYEIFTNTKTLDRHRIVHLVHHNERDGFTRYIGEH